LLSASPQRSFYQNRPQRAGRRDRARDRAHGCPDKSPALDVRSGRRSIAAMAKPFDKWTVFPHGPIEKVWSVEARLPPKAPFSRTMVIVRLGD